MKLILKNFYAELTPDYLIDRIGEVGDLTNKINENDFTFLESKFHKIAGSGGSYGLQEVSIIACQLEEASAEKNITEIIKKFNEYKNLISSIELEFER